jgi:hypothetical protein
MLWSFACLVLAAIDESKPLITQELVDSINNNPNSPFRAALHPQFARMTVKEAKKFLAPVRKSPSEGHGSPRPIGANEREFIHRDRRVFTGFQNVAGVQIWDGSNKYQYTVYNQEDFCSSWAPAVTSAMSLAISIHHKRFVNLSIQFILDCDLMGDPCIERPPLNSYEQFWRRYIPQVGRWDHPSNLLRPPYYTLTQETCNTQGSCYPGWTNCPRNLVLTGTCEPGSTDVSCPIYFLYNWRWIKSHLWEVGPVTSSILVRPAFFTYASGVYSALATPTVVGVFPDESLGGPSGDMADVLGMLDVTIIGWGQRQLNLSADTSNQYMYNRWWYVIPHLGRNFGETCGAVFGVIDGSSPVEHLLGNIGPSVECPTDDKSGIMHFNRRFDDSSIESQAVGAVPFNFHPLPERTQPPTRNP